MIYIRSQPEDYDHWAQLGNRGWSAEDALPYFRASEKWAGPANDVHGTEGLQHTVPVVINLNCVSWPSRLDDRWGGNTERT